MSDFIPSKVEERDHRKVGAKLNLYTLSDDIGKGLVLWLPQGVVLRQKIEEIWRQLHYLFGYQFCYSPHIAKMNLWKSTCQADFHAENLFPPMTVNGTTYLVKAANCPMHILVYKNLVKNYSELPLRIAEPSTIYRNEYSGNVQGLFRVRSVTQDDAHIFCGIEDVKREVENIINLIYKFFEIFGFKNFEFYVGMRDERSIGKDNVWATAWELLISSLEGKVKYELIPGKATFYAPRVGVRVVDRHGRRWPLPDIQIDLQMPRLCNLSYMNKGGLQTQPIIIHRTLLGSMERFIGILLEHYNEGLPVFLSPVQVALIAVNDNYFFYVDQLEYTLRKEKIRTRSYKKQTNIGKNIKEARIDGVPYIAVVGKNYENAHYIEVKGPNQEDMGIIHYKKLIEILHEHEPKIT